MSKAESMLEALRRVNPATSTSSPIPDVADILNGDKQVWAKPVPQRRSKTTWVLVPVMVAVVVLASVMLSNEYEPSVELAFSTIELGGDDRPALDWCNSDVVAYDIDPDDRSTLLARPRRVSPLRSGLWLSSDMVGLQWRLGKMRHDARLEAPGGTTRFRDPTGGPVRPLVV